MTRTPITPTTQQHARNALNHANRIAVALNGTATHDGLISAEVALGRMMDEARALKPLIRAAKADVARRDKAYAADRAIIERDRPALEVTHV